MPVCFTFDKKILLALIMVGLYVIGVFKDPVLQIAHFFSHLLSEEHFHTHTHSDMHGHHDHGHPQLSVLKAFLDLIDHSGGSGKPNGFSSEKQITGIEVFYKKLATCAVAAYRPSVYYSFCLKLFTKLVESPPPWL